MTECHCSLDDDYDNDNDNDNDELQAKRSPSKALFYGDTMDPLPLEKVCELLESEEIPGTPEQVAILCVRIRELTRMNSENWVRRNRKKLLDDWQYLLDRGL